MSQQRIAIHTMGCKANQADTTFLKGSFIEANHTLVSPEDIADVYVINTCTVTDNADKEARRLSRRFRKQNPAAQIIMTGCYAETNPDEVRQLESVDHVITNADKAQLTHILPSIDQHQSSGPLHRQRRVSAFGKGEYTALSRAQVKIQDGCDKFCTFCIIPYARGRNRSVAPEDILNELSSLKAHGFHEAVLTGIHIGTYGEDIGLSLEQLLQMIEQERPIDAVRLSSLDPEEISERLLSLVNESTVICPHLHIAVQHGHDEILQAMGRRHTVAHFTHVVTALTQANPQICLGTDVIVGFPGETDEHFEATYELLIEF